MAQQRLSLSKSIAKMVETRLVLLVMSPLGQTIDGKSKGDNPSVFERYILNT